MLRPFSGRRSWWRLLRRDDGDYHRISYPSRFRQVVGELQRIVEREGVTTVVPVLLRTEEFVRLRVEGLALVVDPASLPL